MENTDENRNQIFNFDTKHPLDNNNFLKVEAEKLDFYYCLTFRISKLSSIKNLYGYATGILLINTLFDKLLSTLEFFKVVYSYDSKLILFLPFENTDINNPNKRIEEIVGVIEKITSSLGNKITLKGIKEPLLVKYYIGACANEKRSLIETLYDLIKFSEIAMENSRYLNTHYTIADETFITEEKDNLDLSFSIMEGLAKDEFVPYYNPIINTKSSKIIGCECISIWEKDRYRVIPPAKFIDNAVQKGVLCLIDQKVIEKSILDYKNWLQNDIVDNKFNIVFNLTLYTMFTLDFEKIASIIEMEKLGIDNFHFSIEGTIIRNRQAIIKLQELKNKGFKLAIDNFGSCKTPTSSILEVNFDTLKLSNMIIPKYEVTPKHNMLSKMFVELAEDLQCNTVAQGIENKQQLNFIINFKYSAVQGFYFSPPLKASDYEIFLKKYRNGLW